jgi:predicted mannosyl-3-phosphoglycerate phosphatase (HAD superfamily)
MTVFQGSNLLTISWFINLPRHPIFDKTFWYNGRMVYKALMLDVDGTLVPYDYIALPSDAVCNAIKNVQEQVIVSLVTGRSYASVENVLKKLSIHSGFAVVNNGSQVIDVAT